MTLSLPLSLSLTPLCHTLLRHTPHLEAEEVQADQCPSRRGGRIVWGIGSRQHGLGHQCPNCVFCVRMFARVMKHVTA